MSRSLDGTRALLPAGRAKTRFEQIAFCKGNKGHFSGDRMVKPKAERLASGGRLKPSAARRGGL
jgi:hypothetical protein